MRFTVLLQLLLLGCLAFNAAVVLAQDDAAPADAAGDDGAGDDAAEGDDATEDGEKEEECEEAWDYVEFLKEKVKNPIESILQDTLFEPKPLLEETVTATMEETLKVRDEILARTKAIRTNDGSVTICEGQNINQEAFLTSTRMEVMAVLLALIEKDAATAEKLQEVGKQLLAIRTRVNGEITNMIMLRTALVRRVTTGDCDCGILPDVVEGLTGLTEKKDDKEEGDGEVVEEGDEPAEGDNEAEGKSGEEGGDDKIGALTMILMDVDAEIRNLYNLILSELDEEKREELSEKLQDHKQLSNQMHEVLSTKLLALRSREGSEDAIERIFKRDVKNIRNDAERMLKNCQKSCPSQCDSCGAEKILELESKLEDYKLTLEADAEEDAKDQIRGDLMNYLTSTSQEMTELLKEKAEAEEGVLEECAQQKLDVITKIKGPLWMMVNITIFGNKDTMNEMITALEAALEEMRTEYCGSEGTPRIEEPETTDECDINEIEQAKTWIVDIDDIISKYLFKEGEDDSRKNAMLGYIDLKASMDDRVRKLFQDNLTCKEEVEQIKNIYTNMLTECLAELMNPRLRFDELDRSSKVQCIKSLRVTIEDRRGELLMREIEQRIRDAQAGAIGAEPASK